MFPLRSHHLVSRTQEGRRAWHELRLPPAQRKLLGLLREPLPVSTLLQAHGAEPGVIEELVWASARDGYLRVDIVEQPAHAVEPEPESSVEKPVDDDKALRDLLDRHRPSVPPQPQATDTPGVDCLAPGAPARPPVSEGPLPGPPSPESAAALARALTGRDPPSRPSQDKPAPGIEPDGQDGLLIKSSDDLMRALTGRQDLGSLVADALEPDEPSHLDDLPDVKVDAPYARDTDPRRASRADREDTFLRITQVIQSRQAAPGAPAPLVSANRPPRAIGETDVAYAARLKAIEDRMERQAAAEAHRQEMAQRRRQEAQDRLGSTREGLSDRLKKALSQRDAERDDQE